MARLSFAVPRRSLGRAHSWLAVTRGSFSAPLPLHTLATSRRHAPDQQNAACHRPRARDDWYTPPATPIAQTLENARERTKAVGEKVRSALPTLRPRENIYNLPNLLTVSRLIAAPVTGYLIVHDQHAWALALFAYAGITDLVDGWLARRWNLQTVAGSVIDPGADKALMIILTVTLAIKGAIPLYLATLILGRDASLALAAIYYRYASLPAPKTFVRYWDFSLPSAEVHPTTVSKYNTFLQLMLIGSTLTLPVITSGGAQLAMVQGVDLHQAMTYFQWLVAGTTAWSGLSYAYLKNAVTMLGSDDELKVKQGARGRAIIGVTFGSVVAAAVWFAVEAGRDAGPVETTDEHKWKA
ncbi:hypothetical protein LTR53_017027 [Teratosphaeriaceae sp. CCFEE 6253]|nr:hypothetical protein LTR53_017027 [Teratosphaeriaceae sp. CCFEE 6253]